MLYDVSKSYNYMFSPNLLNTKIVNESMHDAPLYVVAGIDCQILAALHL